MSERAHDCGSCPPTVGANQFGASGAWTGGYRTSSLSARAVKASTDLSFVVVNLT